MKKKTQNNSKNEVKINKENIFRMGEENIKLQKAQIMLIDKIAEKAIPTAEKYIFTKLEKVEAPRFKWSIIILG